MQNKKSRRIKKGTPSRESLNCALCIVNYALICALRIKKGRLATNFDFVTFSFATICRDDDYRTETPTVSQIYLSQPKESDSCPIPFC